MPHGRCVWEPCNRLVFDLPGLLDGEFLAFAETIGEYAAVGAFALINDDPIVGRLAAAAEVPAPPTLALLAAAIGMFGWLRGNPGASRIFTSRTLKTPA